MAGKSRLKDMSGLRFGSLAVVRRDGFVPGRKSAAWLCRCDCGHEWTVSGDNLRRGRVKTCGRSGCKVHLIERHGRTGQKVHNTWQSMKQRCFNPNSTSFEDYGGRGISVCQRWLDSFENFLEDMGLPEPGWSIERIDNDGDYEPGNCRWAKTAREQAGNRRSTAWIETSRGRLSMSDVAQVAGITYNALQKRMAAGVAGDDLLKPKYTRFSPRSTT